MKRPPSDSASLVPPSLAPPLPALAGAHQQVVGALIDAFWPPLPVPPLGPINSTAAEHGQGQGRGPSQYLDTDRGQAIDQDPTALQRYWAHALSSDWAYLDAVEAAMQRLPRNDALLLRKELEMLSSALRTSLLSGSFRTQSFVKMPWQGASMSCKPCCNEEAVLVNLPGSPTNAVPRWPRSRNCCAGWPCRTQWPATTPCGPQCIVSLLCRRRHGTDRRRHGPTTLDECRLTD